MKVGRLKVRGLNVGRLKVRGLKVGRLKRIFPTFNVQRFKVQLLSLLFVGSFVLTQGFAWFLDASTLPGFAHSPTVAINKKISDEGSGKQRSIESIAKSPLSLVSSSQSPALSVVQDSANPQTLVEQGKAFYEGGKFSEAVRVLQQAAAAFKTQGDKLKEAMTLSNLALAYQQLGAWSEAEQALTESLNLLQSGETLSTTPQGKTTERLQIVAQTLDIQGRLQFASGQPEQALKTWQQAVATYAQIGNKDGKTQSQINQAQALQSLGFYTRACKALLDTLGIDNQDCKISDEQLQALKNQPDSLTKAVALRSLGDVLQLVGDLQQAENVLKLSLEIAQRLQSPQNISAARFSLANTARAQRTTKTEGKSRQATEDPMRLYQQVAEEATSPTIRIQAQLNQLSLLIEAKNFSQAQALASQIQSQVNSLPPSRAAVYARINLAQSLLKIGNAQQVSNSQEIAQLLAKAIDQAKRLGDGRATAYALGNLGELYQKTGQLNEAKDLTNQALVMAQTINASDIAYRWQWQLGRLLKARGEQKEAIVAYDAAVKTLKSLRSDLVSINPDVQFSFRESIEPVYREFVELLLQSDADQENLAKAREVIESLQLAELVNFFREDCLTGTQVKIDQIDQKAAVIYPIVLKDRIEVVLSVPNGAAEAPLRHYATRLPREKVEETFNELRKAIAPFINDPTRGQAVQGTDTNSDPGQPVQGTETNSDPGQPIEGTETNPNQGKQVEGKDTNPDPGQPVEGTETSPEQRGIRPEQRSQCNDRGIRPEQRRELGCDDKRTQPSQEYLPLAQQVYDWLIRPAEQEIAASGAKTLVFVLDVALLNLPMAVLNDGKQFLVEKYAIAYTPGLQLLNSTQQARGQLSALKAGISKERELKLSSSAEPLPFPALPFVKEELQQIQSKVTGELLLDEQFTTAAIQKEIDSIPFPVVHLATHGVFSSNAEDTFILTWDDRLSVNQLSNVLRARAETGRGAIELLVLSACQTAAGDKRAALGLAGVAVKAGARSTLATLWFVSDEATAALMNRFYQELSDTTISKAEALRRAQVALLKDSRYEKPILWAPYVLVGNWL